MARTGQGRSRGQALVEFAVAGTLFFLIVIGTLDFGRVIFMYAQMHNAVREGARYGKVHTDPFVAGDVTGVVQDRAPTLAFSSLSATCGGGCEPGDGTVTVNASFVFTPITAGLLGIGSFTVSSSATVDVE